MTNMKKVALCITTLIWFSAALFFSPGCANVTAQQALVFEGKVTTYEAALRQEANDAILFLPIDRQAAARADMGRLFAALDAVLASKDAIIDDALANGGKVDISTVAVQIGAGLGAIIRAIEDFGTQRQASFTLVKERTMKLPGASEGYMAGER
jgi:hypothetical protein